MTLVLSHFRRRDPVIYQALVTMELEPLRPTVAPDQYFARLARSITGQQLSVKVARTIFDRLAELLAGDVTPARLLAADDQALRDIGLSWAKVRYLKDLAARVSAKQLRLNWLAAASDEQVIAELTTVKGIGQWTAEMFLMFALGREDLFSHGDLGLRRALEKLYNFDHQPTSSEIDQVTDKWRPYRTYGCLALWHTLDNVPAESAV